jgi:pullulanase-type alpha-1,6-glucosidase
MFLFGLGLAAALVTPVLAQPLEHSRAHWLTSRFLAWPEVASATGPEDAPVAEDEARFWLHAGGEAASGYAEALEGTAPIELAPIPGDWPASLAQRFPHLAGSRLLELPRMPNERLRDMLRGPLAVSAGDTDGRTLAVTGVQIPGVLDELFATAATRSAELGVVFEDDRPAFRLWAPTARAVGLLLFQAGASDGASESRAMERHVLQGDPDTGIWSLVGEPDWNRSFYLYEVEVFMPETGRVEKNRVTDPYSLSLAADSARSQVLDLDDADLAPPGWADMTKPAPVTPVDMVLYELHVRDFSWRDERVPAAERGTYRAFRHADSHGMRHLARLARAGLTHVHLLPVFDIATVPERRADQLVVDEARLAGLPPDSPEPQAAVESIRDQDGFNWGYDPWHYTVPEGSYATAPDGPARIVEFREMVQALAGAGLRVVMDVVYNHTHAAGRERGSVLDQIVPGYYQRLDDQGRVATSTCCANTASEHRMMEKLLIDSVLTWARHYRVDGFRFDLMGHHSLANMQRLRAALDALTVERDGVDGRGVYLYGEGWDFGEVAGDARFVQARQANLGGSGIGSFSDRLRDGARGGAYDSHPSAQGFVNGLAIDPSVWSLRQDTDPDDTLAELLRRTDWIRVGLAADLADFRLQAADGFQRRAEEIDYNGSPAGYTRDPAENIAYVAAHDNETLFDANQLKLPRGTSMDGRVRAQTLASALVLLGQGVPFIHAGQEFLRSKSMDRNSFNSGDWYNAIDWSFARGNWGRGLPPAEENGTHWPLMGELLRDTALAPSAADRRAALEEFERLLRIRRSTRLLRLRSAAEIREHVEFHNTGPNQAPGVIVMAVSDRRGQLGDPYSHLLVLFNARPVPVDFAVSALEGLPWRVHPELEGLSLAHPGAAAEFTAPARSAVVFVVETADLD